MTQKVVVRGSEIQKQMTLSSSEIMKQQLITETVWTHWQLKLTEHLLMINSGL